MMTEKEIETVKNALKLIDDLRSENEIQKLTFQLFIGKVVDEIGLDRTTVLLKEAKNAFKG